MTSCFNKGIAEDPKSTFEYQLALLFRDGNNFTNNVGLNPKLKIYIEHSNEVWNFGFKQHVMNEAFAEWEVLNASTRITSPGTKKPASNLDKLVPNRPDIEGRQSCSNTSTVVRPGKPGQKDSVSVVGAACWASDKLWIFLVGDNSRELRGCLSPTPSSHDGVWGGGGSLPVSPRGR